MTSYTQPNIISTRPCPQGELVPKGLLLLVKLDSSYQLSKIAEILWVNQQGEIR